MRDEEWHGKHVAIREAFPTATTERALRAAVRRRSEAAAATAAKKKKSKNKNKKRKSKKERNGNGDGDQGEDEIDEADGAEEDATEDFQDAVMVVPSAVSDELCDLIVELFEATEGWAGYPGNFLREGAGVVVDKSEKSTREIEIAAVGEDTSESAAAATAGATSIGRDGSGDGFNKKHGSAASSSVPHTPNKCCNGSSWARDLWAGVDWVLLQALTAALAAYEERLPGFSYMPNPLHDDGFRVKRYDSPSKSKSSSSSSSSSFSTSSISAE